MSLSENDCLNDDSGWIDLGFVERERTPEQFVEVGDSAAFGGLSLSNTKQYLEKSSAERSRAAIPEWAKTVDLQPEPDTVPNQIAVEETVIRVDGHREWLYAVSIQRRTILARAPVSRANNRTNLFLCEPKRDLPSRKPRFSQTAYTFRRLHSADSGTDFRRIAIEIGMLSNVSLER